MFYYHPHTGRFEQNSRSVRASSVFTPRTSRYSYDEGYVPYSRPLYSSYGRYDSTGEENLNRSQINRNLILSSAALDDNYDISVRSRNRDRDVLASANRAIVDTEIHSSPRSAVAARRVMRGQSTPPSAFQSKREVHAALARAKYNNVGYTVPPASAKHQHTRSVRVTINPRYRFTLPKKTGRWHQSYQKAKETTSQTDIEGLRRAPLSILAYLRNLELRLKSKRFRPSNTTFVPVRSAYTKAALIGSRVDVVSPDSGVRRRPRSVYAQTKVRQLESSKRLKDGSPVAVVAERTTDLKASRPVRAPTLVKPIHDVDGIKQPSNILSWKYKLDAITSPDDFIIVPRSLNSVKCQLRNAQEKMTKHRQLMDRYLNQDSGLTFEDKMAICASKAHLGARA